MLGIRFTRKFALVTVPVLAAGGIVAGVLAVGSQAAPSTTGFSYVVGIAAGGKTIGLGDLTDAIVQRDPLAVVESMTPAERTAAAKAIGGTPAVGLTVTKTFDLTDKAVSVAALAQTKVSVVGLWTYFDGKVCDHIRSNPMYVASVDQTGPQAGTSASIMETIEFTGRAFSQVVPDTCPAQTIAPTSGVRYTGEMTVDGQTSRLTSISKFSVIENPAEAQLGTTSGEEKKFEGAYGHPVTLELEVVKSIDLSDEAFKANDDVGSLLTGTFVFEQFNNPSAPMETLTFTDPLIVKFNVEDSNGALPKETIDFAVDSMKVTYNCAACS